MPPWASRTLELVDTANPGGLTLADAYDVTAAPGTPVASPAYIGVSQGATSVTFTATGLETGAKLSLVSTVDGTSLTVGAATLNAAGTALTATVTPTNAVTGAAATLGTYDVTVTNPDGGTTTVAGTFSVDVLTVSEVSPSSPAGCCWKYHADDHRLGL